MCMYRERDRERHACMHTYTQTHIHIYIYICIFIFIYILKTNGAPANDPAGLGWQRRERYGPSLWFSVRHRSFEARKNIRIC